MIGIIHDGTQFHRAGIKRGELDSFRRRAVAESSAPRQMQDHRSLADQANGDARSRRVGVTLFVSAATSNASIATSQAVVLCSDLERAKIYSLASSSVCRILPSGKTIGRSKRLFQDTDATPQIRKKARRASTPEPINNFGFLQMFLRQKCPGGDRARKPLCAAGAHDQADSDAGDHAFRVGASGL